MSALLYFPAKRPTKNITTDNKNIAGLIIHANINNPIVTTNSRIAKIINPNVSLFIL
jgi:hypothetical protein